MPGINGEKLLKIGEVGEFFRVGPKTVAKWAAAGLLTSVKIQHSVRFREADVRRLLESKTG